MLGPLVTRLTHEKLEEIHLTLLKMNITTYLLLESINFESFCFMKLHSYDTLIIYRDKLK